MKVFKLGCHVTVSAYTEVLAETLNEAIKIAAGRDVVLGGTGSGAYPDESWIIDDPDGAPTDIKQED